MDIFSMHRYRWSQTKPGMLKVMLIKINYLLLSLIKGLRVMYRYCRDQKLNPNLNSVSL